MISRNKLRHCIYLATLPLVVTLPAHASSINDLPEVIENITQLFPNLMRMITAIAYVSGMYCIYEGILDLKQFGEQRSQYSTHASLKGPLIRLTVGTLLLYLPSAVNASLTSMWETPTPYAYLQHSDWDWSIITACAFGLVQIVGTIAFVRGLLTLNKLAGHGGGMHDAWSRGVTHIVAGALCINLYNFLEAVFTTLGLDGLL